jgi:uncharacterized protein YdiU (UPF0061 family)
MAVGFMHGVMNTDNMSILGLTLDYGPFGFMEAFDAGHICNHSDHRAATPTATSRMSRNGTSIAWPTPCQPGWRRAAGRQAVDETYGEAFETTFERLLRAKLGLREALPDDEAFIGETFASCSSTGPISRCSSAAFPACRRRGGGRYGAHRCALTRPVRRSRRLRRLVAGWRAVWRNAVADAERQAAMLAANPKYVLRNWLAEVAIRQARAGDFSEVQRLLSCLRQTLRRTAGIRGLCSLAAGLGERPGSQLLQLMAAG